MALLLAISAVCFSAGCGAPTFNVRASRAFSNEDADPEIDTDRVEDLTRSQELGVELITAIPYSPGDAWVAALPLESDAGDELKSDLRKKGAYENTDYEMPILKLYRVHLEEVLKTARAPRQTPAKYPSVAAAMADLGPPFAGYQDQWDALFKAQKAGSAAGVFAAKRALHGTAASLLTLDARQGERAVIAHDALQVTSYVLRMDEEALAVAPYTETQAERLAGHDRSYAPLVTRAQYAEAAAHDRAEVLDPTANGLARAAGVDLQASAGFRYSESFFDQAAGVSWDSTHFHLKGDGEVLWFNQIESDNASGAANDYTGRTRRLEYHIKPVAMVGARLIAAFDWLHIKNVATLNGGFTTDRLWSAGGTIQNNNSLGQLLGLKGLASDFFDIGVGLLGFHTSVVFAKFTSGTVRQIAVDPTTGADVGTTAEAPFQLTYNLIDVGYDLTVPFPVLSDRFYTEELLVGFRYMDYRLPRVFYELTEKDALADPITYQFSRESQPQTVDSKFYMGGISARIGQGDWERVSFFGDIGIFGGAGPVSFFLPKDPKMPDSTANRDQQSATMIALNASLGLGGRLRLTPRRSRARVVIELQYHGELIGQGIVSEIRETDLANGDTIYSVGKKIDVGGFDLFHGPRLRIVGAF